MGALAALLILSLGGPAAHGVDLHGMIREVKGDVVTVIVEGDVVPNAGDKVAIFFKMAGLDDEISVASGHVVEVGHESIKVEIESSTGTVAKDQLARITSENPRKREAVAEAKSVTLPSAPLPQSEAPPNLPPAATTAHRSEVQQIATHVFTFDELTVGPLPLDAFASAGIRFRTEKGEPAIHAAEPNMLLPSPHGKVLLVGGGPVNTVTILLDPPVKHFALFRVGASNGASTPTWKMTAYNGAGKIVGSTGEEHKIAPAAAHFSIEAADIGRVEISADNRHGRGTWATWNSLPIVGVGFDR